MPSTYSSNLKIELMSTGENSGTWGDVTNTNLGTALEQAIVGYGTVDYIADANLTISITNNNASQAARALVLNVTSAFGSLTQTRELVVPTIQKQYIVQNNTTGGQSITVKTSAGTGITVPNGRKAHLYVDGTNVIQMFDFVDINGGTIDGATVGANSASSGAFTTLSASGATTLNGAVTLGDAAGDNITFNGTVTSHLLFTDNTYDIGANGATRPRNLFLAGSATVGGNLSVGGTLTLTGGVNLNGNVTVGDNASDTLTINSTITSNLLFTDNTYDIGASGATRPRNLFLAGNATIGGNQTLTGSLTVDSTTDSTSATTGSIQTDGGLGIAKALFVGTTVTVNGGTANGVAYLNGSKVLTTGSALTFDGSSMVLNTSTSSDALRITQTGAGNALLVEDSANPDSTPFVINASGQTVIGYTVPVLNALSAVAPTFQIHGIGAGPAAASITSWATGGAVGARLLLSRSEGGVVGTQTIVDSGDQMGYVGFTASDGTGFIEGARIVAEVDGTPGTNDMPGRLIFSTTADGASTPTERMRIDNAGRVGIGSIPVVWARQTIGGTLPSSSGLSTHYDAAGTVPSTSTTQADGFLSRYTTAAASFTLGAMTHFRASQGTLGAGSSVTNQYGFTASFNLTGATNNFGFYSDIPSGTGRWNFYASGTAANYFEGATTFNSGLTLNAGTANGVAYLNGSKVLTTGSALVYDGTILRINGSTTSGLRLASSSGSSNGFNIYNDSTTDIAYLTNYYNGSMVFGINNAEQMRLTSTGLGIGTSSPAYKLHSVSSASSTGAFFETTTTDAYIGVKNSSSAGYIGVLSSGNMVFQTPGSSYATKLTIDNSGNLGLGVTPSALLWPNGSTGGLQLQAGALLSAYNATTYLSNNWYYNAGEKYIGNGYATRYEQTQGKHAWYYAGNNTSGAGATVSWTQAMTLDASGRLGIGVTSPGQPLQVNGRIRISPDGSSGGDLGINNSGLALSSLGANPIQFWLNNYATEAARIDSSGNLLVGTTSSAGLGVTVQPVGTLIQNNNAQASGFVFVSFRRSNTEIGFIDQNGTTAVRYSTTSDYRLKENVQPMTGALAKVAALKPVTYKWKADGTEGQGFIAHELQAVVPDAVTGEKDAVNEDGSIKPQGIDTSFLVATLTAAIQEQQAIIDQINAKVEAQAAEIAALKSK